MRYTAVLFDADGVERVSLHELSPGTRDGRAQVTAAFAAAYLPQGSYVIQLKTKNGNTIESYPFSTRVD
jgi:hypothetical protein